jgi:hypothetical protein
MLKINPAIALAKYTCLPPFIACTKIIYALVEIATSRSSNNKQRTKLSPSTEWRSQYA